MAGKKGVVEDGKGVFLCYLDEEYSNGGIDLYDEYNKGVGKIVDAFQQCCEKQKRAETGEQDKADAIRQSEREKQGKLSVFRDEKDGRAAKIAEAIERRDLEIADEKRKCEEVIRAYDLDRERQDAILEDTPRRGQEALQADYREAIARKRQQDEEILAAYRAAGGNLARVQARLQRKISLHRALCGQIKNRISRLEDNKKTIYSDEAIERAVERYVSDKSNFARAWRRKANQEGRRVTPEYIEEFRRRGWLSAVEERRGQFLMGREEALDWNRKLDQRISKENIKLQRAVKETSSFEARYAQLSGWMSTLKEKHEKLQAFKTKDQQTPGAGTSVRLGGDVAELNCRDWNLVRIDWLQTGETLQAQCDEAIGELDSLLEAHEREIQSKAMAYEQLRRETEESALEAKRVLELQADRRKIEAGKQRDDAIEKIKDRCRLEMARLGVGLDAGELAGLTTPQEDEAYREKAAQLAAQMGQKIAEAEESYREEEARLGAEWDEKIRRLDAEYREELNSLLNQLDKDGMAGICGFNYKNAWRIFHGMATSTIAFPLVDKDDDDLLLKGLTAKAASADFDHCYFMPGHVMWGYSPADLSGLTPEIKGKIRDVLERGEEFGGKGGWDSIGDIEKYHLEETPVDTFYKLDCTSVQDGPAMIFYDLGDLEKDEGKRDRLMEFIQRVFLFDMAQCVGSDSYLNIDVISTRYDEYFTDSGITDFWGGEVAKDMASAKKKIEELHKDRQEGLTLGNGENLHEKNRKRSEAGRNPSDRYEALIVVNTDYKGLADTALGSLLRISARQGRGMYTFLFVDMDRIGRMERPDGERDALQGFLNDINREGSFYEIREQDARLTLGNIGKDEAALRIDHLGQ